MVIMGNLNRLGKPDKLDKFGELYRAIDSWLEALGIVKPIKANQRELAIQVLNAAKDSLFRA